MKVPDPPTNGKCPLCKRDMTAAFYTWPEKETEKLWECVPCTKSTGSIQLFGVARVEFEKNATLLQRQDLEVRMIVRKQREKRGL